MSNINNEHFNEMKMLLDEYENFQKIMDQYDFSKTSAKSIAIKSVVEELPSPGNKNTESKEFS